MSLGGGGSKSGSRSPYDGGLIGRSRPILKREHDLTLDGIGSKMLSGRKSADDLNLEWRPPGAVEIPEKPVGKKPERIQKKGRSPEYY